jgi:hypothetical protein
MGHCHSVGRGGAIALAIPEPFENRSVERECDRGDRGPYRAGWSCAPAEIHLRIGPGCRVAQLAANGCGQEFRRLGDLAAWLSLVPRE